MYFVSRWPTAAFSRLQHLSWFLQSRLMSLVPAVTPRTLATCRILIGHVLAYFLIFAAEPQLLRVLADNGPLRGGFVSSIDGGHGVLTMLSSSEWARNIIYASTAVFVLSFIAGWRTKITYPMLVGLLWLTAFLRNWGHFATPLLLGMTACLPARWSERWSIDAWTKGKSDAGVASVLYGYPIWLLGLAIGLAYAAAGVSKIVLTDGAWLWDTGARYGFIQDYNLALTDWGIALSNNYWLAVVSSLISAVGQIIYLYACFTRSMTVKYGICFLIALPFLVGLILFMGLFWWPWALLVAVLYMPWRWLDNRIAPGAPHAPMSSGHGRWFISAAVVLIGLHVYPIVDMREWEPVYSHFPMYASKMRAGSREEARFWTRYKSYNRHYRWVIEISGETSSGQIALADLSLGYHLAEFFESIGVWRASILEFSPARFSQPIAIQQPPPRDTCDRLEELAESYLPAGSDAVRVRFAKLYIDIVDGVVVQLPPSDVYDLDLAGSNCRVVPAS